MNIGRQTIYRRLEEVGWSSGRKKRADRGEIVVTEDLAQKLSGLVVTGTRANGKRIMGMAQARKILEDNFEGVVDPETGEITMPAVSTLSRAMRQLGCHPDQLAKGPTVTHMRSLHPNHVWQGDASVCVLFYLPTGKLCVMDEKKFYKNKPADVARIAKEKVIRWVITDHYSGEIYCCYTLGAEDAIGLINALIGAASPRPGEVMQGLPFIFVSDKGSGNTGLLAAHFFKRTGIKHITHAPGNPRAKGQVEQANNLIETHFENRLRTMDVTDLASLNAEAAQWRRVWNATAKHSRHGRTRDGMWITIQPEQLRVPASAEVLRELVSKPPKTVKVTPDMVISHPHKNYGTQAYDIRTIPGIVIGQSVQVSVNPYRAPDIDVIVTAADGAEYIYTVTPIARDVAGFNVNDPVWDVDFKSLPDTKADTALKDIKKAAYGVDTLEEAKKAETKNGRVYSGIDGMADIKAALPTLPTYLPRGGTPFEISLSQRELPPLNHVEAAQRLRVMLATAGASWDATCMEWLQSTYPDSVPVTAIDEIAATLVAARQMPVPEDKPTLRLVVGG